MEIHRRLFLQNTKAVIRMGDKSKTFQQLFNAIFIEDKVKTDFILYLSAMCDKTNSGFIVSVYNEDTEISKKVIIEIDDAIKIISCKCVLDFNTDIDYEVRIAIGDFLENSKQIYAFEVEKCIAKLRYNCDFEVYDVEFTLNKINEIQR